MFIFAQILHGFGCTPLYTIGFSYVEDSTTAENAGLHFAFILGPFLQFIQSISIKILRLLFAMISFNNASLMGKRSCLRTILDILDLEIFTHLFLDQLKYLKANNL